jgi:hypothetical protein
MKLKFYLTLFIITISFYIVKAQVGINTQTPDKLSVLDLGKSKKGLLIPRLNTSDRLTLGTKTNVEQNSLMVFDTDVNAFFVLLDNKWYSLNGWNTRTENNPNQNTSLDGVLMKKVGISDDPTATEILAVGGNTRIEGNLIANGLNSSGDLTVNGNVSATGNYIVNDRIKGFTAPGYSSKGKVGSAGPVPAGTIVMWNGDLSYFNTQTGLGYGKMAGWALCNGGNGRPNLIGNFVVGAKGKYAPNTSGGKIDHRLSIREMPEHSHEQNDKGNHSHPFPNAELYNTAGTENNEAGGDGVSGSFHGTKDATISKNLSMDSAGGDQPHENRPPFYAVYFIIKL